MLSLYRRLLELRRAEAALSVGGYDPVEAEGDVFAFRRRFDGGEFLIALNFSGHSVVFALPDDIHGRCAAVLSTHLDREGETFHGTLPLRPAEGLIVRLTERDSVAE